MDEAEPGVERAAQAETDPDLPRAQMLGKTLEREFGLIGGHAKGDLSSEALNGLPVQRLRIRFAKGAIGADGTVGFAHLLFGRLLHADQNATAVTVGPAKAFGEIGRGLLVLRCRLGWDDELAPRRTLQAQHQLWLRYGRRVYRASSAALPFTGRR